jgi:hypothetical protein
LKKSSLIAFTALLFLILASYSVQASVQWTYLGECVQSFSIDSAGLAHIESITRGQAGVTSVETVANLQQYNNGNWTTIKSWPAAQSGAYVNLSRDWYVTHGSYRLQTVHTAYYNGASESRTINTNTATY